MASTQALDDRQLPRQWRAEYADPELAREFRANPLGPHSDRLRRLAAMLRSAPLAGRPVILEREDGRLDVGTLPDLIGDPIEISGEPVDGGDRAEAERRAFAIRWRAVFGTEVPW